MRQLVGVLLILAAIALLRFPAIVPGIDPVTEPSPFDEPGKRLLIVTDYDAQISYTMDQQEILRSVGFRQWLDSRGIEYRIWDRNQQTGDDVWGRAFRLPRDDLPWIYYGDGDKGFSRPMPGSVAELQVLIEE
jgi:hypothetical protein